MKNKQTNNITSLFTCLTKVGLVQWNESQKCVEVWGNDIWESYLKVSILYVVYFLLFMLIFIHYHHVNNINLIFIQRNPKACGKDCATRKGVEVTINAIEELNVKKATKNFYSLL